MSRVSTIPTSFVMISNAAARNGGNMLYGLRVYSALSELGLRPTSFSSKYRVFMWRAGRVFGNSPQEVAVFMAARVAAAHRPRLRRAVIKMWIQKRKIDPAADHVHAALTALDV
jgi:hypothetical protein